jgi:hypothetical protein
MRAPAIAVLIILVISIVYPALATSENRYGYITVDSLVIKLSNATAEITVEYQLDGGAMFILFFLGKNDLKQKLQKILNYEDAQVTSIDMKSATFLVKNVSYIYGEGIYWFPNHEFNIMIPSLTIHTPRLSRHYNYTSEFPNGIGYFSE